MKPLSIKVINNYLFFILLIGAILHFGKEILIVIIFSGLLAMLMAPFSNKMENSGINRVLSSLISVFIILIVISIVLFLISAQINNISQDFPQIKSKSETLINNTELWIERNLGISPKKQIATIKEQASKALNMAGTILMNLIKGTFAFFGGFLLVLVFVFLMLLHREKYENFILMFYPDEKKEKAKDVLGQVTKIAQQYLYGRLISIIILTVLYLIGFVLIGLKNAFLLSAIAAIVTFIPYVGPFLGGLLPFAMAIVSGSINIAIGVVIIILISQAFDNYFIEPYVVGGSVSISPLFTIIILLMGGLIWGISGVILFLPLLGIIKIIFDNLDGLQPLAYLIGNQKESSEPKIWSRFKGIFKK